MLRNIRYLWLTFEFHYGFSDEIYRRPNVIANLNKALISQLFVLMVLSLIHMPCGDGEWRWSTFLRLTIVMVTAINKHFRRLMCSADVEVNSGERGQGINSVEKKQPHFTLIANKYYHFVSVDKNRWLREGGCSLCYPKWTCTSRFIFLARKKHFRFMPCLVNIYLCALWVINL